MNESVRELKILSVSKCTRDGGAYMAILRELEGERMMPVLMDRSDALQLLMKMKGRRTNGFPMCIADVMRAVFAQSEMDVVEVRIIAVQAGNTYCHILFRDHGFYRMIRGCRAADGLILAYTFNSPITIGESLLAQQYMRELDGGLYSMPVNSVNIEALKEALERAIEEENYELASQLRDEIERRK